MTHVSTNPQPFATEGSFFKRLFSLIGDKLVAASRSNARLRQAEALSLMSDEQLAARGMKRADIVRHVFRDVYWM